MECAIAMAFATTDWAVSFKVDVLSPQESKQVSSRLNCSSVFLALTPHLDTHALDLITNYAQVHHTT
jgi:hypothetical protein